MDQDTNSLAVASSSTSIVDVHLFQKKDEDSLITASKTCLKLPLFEGKYKKCTEQVEDSQNIISKLQRDGEELITDVALVSNISETAKGLQEVQARATRLAELTEQGEEAEKKYRELVSKLEKAKTLKIPNKLHERIQQLKVECDEYLVQKDSMIATLQDDLKKKDEDFALNQQKLETEIPLMSRRINQLIKELDITSQVEMQRIKATLEKLREEDISHSLSKFLEAVTKIESDKSVEGLGTATWKSTMYVVERSRVSNDNRIALLRGTLEMDVHKLSKTLQVMEATQFLNLEKLSYGLHLLKQQIRESRIIRSELLREKVQIFDSLMVLRAKLRKLNQEGATKYKKFTGYYTKMHSQLQETIKFARFFHGVHSKQFSEVFKKRESDARKLLHLVLIADRRIFEDWLDKKWVPPNLSFLWQSRSSAPTEEERLRLLLQSFMNEGTNGDNLPEDDYSSDTGDMEEDDLPSVTSSALHITRPLQIETFLEFICDQLYFLIDTQVVELSKIVFPSLQMFITSSSFFNDIGIEKIEDLNMFMAHVLDHATIVNSRGDAVLNSKDVLKAFGNYLAARKAKIEYGDLYFDASVSSDNREHMDFWKPYQTILPKPKENLWDAVSSDLLRYLSMLEDRAKLRQEKNFLMEQNKELQGVMHHFLEHCDESCALCIAANRD